MPENAIHGWAKEFPDKREINATEVGDANWIWTSASIPTRAAAYKMDDDITASAALRVNIVVWAVTAHSIFAQIDARPCVSGYIGKICVILDVEGRSDWVVTQAQNQCE